MLGGKSVNGNPVLFPKEKSTPYHKIVGKF